MSSFVPFLNDIDALTKIYQWIVSFNPQDAVFQGVVTLFELLLYIPVAVITNFYTFFSNIYSVLYGGIAFVNGLYTLVTLMKTGYWPSSMSSMITYLMFLSIGVANSRLIFNIVLRIYRAIPFVGGR